MISMKIGLDLAWFVVHVVKMLSVLVLRRICYHLNLISVWSWCLGNFASDPSWPVKALCPATY